MRRSGVVLRLVNRIGDAADHGDIDQAICWIGRGFNEHHRNPTVVHRLVRRLPDGSLIKTISKAYGADREASERLR